MIPRGVGYLGSKPIPVTPTEGMYKSSQNFGNMASVTDVLEGGGKYGFRDWDELESFLKQSNLNPKQYNYAMEVINRLKGFEDGLTFGPETTQGLIPSKLRNNLTKYQQYLNDQLELSDILAGNMNYGSKNQRVIFRAPNQRSIITGIGNKEGFGTRTANINMRLNDPFGNQFKYFTERGIPQNTWRNGMIAEQQISNYNLNPQLQRTILSRHPSVIFPLHFRGTGQIHSLE